MDPSLEPGAEDGHPQTHHHAKNRPRKHGRLGCCFGFSIAIILSLAALFLIPAAQEGAPPKKQRLKAMLDAWRGIVPEPEVVIQKEKEIVEVEKLVPGPAVPGPPPPPPSKWVPRKEIDTAKLYNGLVTRSELKEVEGRGAATEREDDASYGVEIEVKITIPTATKTLDGLAALNPDLPQALPGLAAMMPVAKVSGFYHQLYDNKRKYVQASYARLDRVLDRHNFYDCETILELRSPDTGRRALLLQSEMDVVSDGTDGDRMPELSDHIANSANYQPSTSYKWKKKTDQPNPLLTRYTDAIDRDLALLKKPGLTAQEKATLERKLSINRRIANDLGYWSYLIAEIDPFVVIPGFIPKQKPNTPFAPVPGDYAVVIYGDRVFPAIVGDTGPSHKTGEASLHMSQELNPKAGVYSRPVTDLEVTYLYFPGTAEPTPDAPDLERWHQRCTELLGEIGGLGEGFELHRWEDPQKDSQSE